MNNLKKTIGAKIVKLRKATGLTQAELAGLPACSRSGVSRIESGKAMSAPGFVCRAADACNPACHYWMARFGELNEPACSYYKTLCSAAIEKRKREVSEATASEGLTAVMSAPEKSNETKEIKYSGGTASAWPGTNRGWGPITRKLEDEQEA